MSRPPNADLSKPWKLNMPATLAGQVEFLLLDPIHQQPIYGARGRLVVSLLEWWIAREKGVAQDQLPPIPTLLELRSMESR